MAIAIQAPELELSEAEAERYARAIASVARHYDVGASAKTLDWFNLCTTMGSIYGVRAMAIVARRKGQQRPRPQPGMGHNGGPAMNGNATPAADQEAPAEDGGTAVDWSLMTGRAQ